MSEMSEEKELLLKNWLKFKKAEDKNKKLRTEIEKEIEALYGTNFKETSKTFNEPGFKVTVKKNVAYNLDQDGYISIRQDIPENLRPEKINFSLNVKGYEWLRANEQEIFKKISGCVEIKNNKTTIKVEKIK